MTPEQEAQVAQAHEVLDGLIAEVKQKGRAIGADIQHLRASTQSYNPFLRNLDDMTRTIRDANTRDHDPRNHIDAKLDWLKLRSEGINDWIIIVLEMTGKLNAEASSVMKLVHGRSADEISYDPPANTPGVDSGWKYENKGRGNQWHSLTGSSEQEEHDSTGGRLTAPQSSTTNVAHQDVEPIQRRTHRPVPTSNFEQLSPNIADFAAARARSDVETVDANTPVRNTARSSSDSPHLSAAEAVKTRSRKASTKTRERSQSVDADYEPSSCSENETPRRRGTRRQGRY